MNTLLYEYLAAHSGLGDRIEPMPEPIPSINRAPTVESRRRLHIPEDGRYVGLIGVIDRRKAVAPLLAAFAKVREPGDHLLIAGKMDPVHRGLIAERYEPLVRSGALIVMDEFLQRTV